MNLLFSKIIGWATDRNIIGGSTAQQQFPKLLEEVIELYATLHPNKSRAQIIGGIGLIIDGLDVKGKIKQAPAGKRITDDIGDITVVATIMATQEGLTMKECVQHAYNDIEHRKGMMINGVFVKQADL